MGDSNIKLIILDRDGVINYDSDDYIKTPEEWIPIPGSLEAIARLNKAGYKVAVATNQSGIARGYYDLDILEKMHQKMQKLLAEVNGKVDHISFCPHAPDDNCLCRKPKPSMLLEIADSFAVSSEAVTFVGDTATDMQAAKAANMKFVLVKTGKGENTISKLGEIERKSVFMYESLKGFVEELLEGGIPYSLRP